jgi:hypothetical protein
MRGDKLRGLAQAVIAKAGPRPALLVGCHAAGLSLPCCEVDIVVFAEKEGVESQELLGLPCRMYTLEATPSEAFATRPEHYIGAIPLVDPNMELGGLAEALGKRLVALARERALQATRAILRSLTCTKMQQLDAARLWLSIAAYMIAESFLIEKRLRPSPTHLLQALRGLDPRLLRGLLTMLGDEAASFAQPRLAAYELFAQQERLEAGPATLKRARWLIGQGRTSEASCLLGYRLLEASGALSLGLEPRAPPLSLRPRLLARIVKAGWPTWSRPELELMADTLLALLAKRWGR